MTTSTTIVRANERFVTDLGWLDSKHCFNFGPHYSPKHTGHGLLLVSNDDVVAGGGGFGTHGHRDMEIVTWVLSGNLEHRDSEGNHGVLYPGLAQRMSAGSGIMHSEMNASATEPVHFVQMWVPPHDKGIKPGYQQLDVNEQLAGGGLVPIASGAGHADSISIHQRDAVFYGARLVGGATAVLPHAANVHVFVGLGSVELSSGATLERGDATRLSNVSADLEFIGGPNGAEILVWATA
jgi:quercetin 2,3-dioxygenase